MAPTDGNDFSPNEKPDVTPTPDPFDPERLRISQDAFSAVGVKKAVLTVPVKKPAREWFSQTHPDEAYRIQTAVLELKEDRELYLVDPSLWADLQAEPSFGMRALFTAMTRQGVLSLWPVRLPGPDGKIDEWSRSALEAANLASGRWVRVMANMHLGADDANHESAASGAGHSGSDSLPSARRAGQRPNDGAEIADACIEVQLAITTRRVVPFQQMTVHH